MDDKNTREGVDFFIGFMVGFGIELLIAGFIILIMYLA